MILTLLHGASVAPRWVVGQDAEPIAVERGAVRGTVVDAETGAPLPGASITVEDTSIGVAADNEGNYYLDGLPAGEQTLVARFIGYDSLSFDVTVIGEEVVERNVELTPAIVEGDEVIVSAQALGQAEAIRRQLASNTIVNVVSEARIREVPDANAAESVGRLPGVSIIRDGGEARNVAIRGLSPRYNNVTFDGDRVPSTDLDGRAVDLHFISQEMLSGIEVYKSSRPDMDADAIGGTINFNLARIPEATIARFNAKGGYSDHINDVSNFGGSFSGSSRFLSNRLGIAGSFDIARNDRSSDELTSSYDVLRPAREGESHAPLEILNMDVLARSETRDRVGASLMADLDIPNGRILLSGFASRLNRDFTEFRRNFNLDGNRQRWFFTNRDIEVDVLSTRLSGEHRFPALMGTLVEWRISHGVSTRNHPFDHLVEFQELSAFDEGMDRRGDVTNIAGFAKNDFENAQLWRSDLADTDARERDLTGQLDFTIPIRFAGRLSADLKIGGKQLIKYRDRTNEAIALFLPNHDARRVIEESGRDMSTTDRGNVAMVNYTDSEYQRDNLFLGNFGLPIGLHSQSLNAISDIHRHRYEDVVASPMNDQHGRERISAAYVMSEMNLGRRIMFMPGVRYEYTDGEYDAVYGVASGTMDHIGWHRDTTATRSFGQWFPMVQMRYQVADWFNVRAAYTRSSSRPNFTEIVPRSRINPEGRFVNRGNPSLRPAEATNYDLAFTFHSSRIGLVTIGGFYKEIDNLIFTRTRRVLGDYEELGLTRSENNFDLTEPLNNPLGTTARGAEFEWQSILTWLPSPFNGIVINANVTAMHTETQYPRSTLVRTEEGLVRVDTFRVGPMPEQPDYMANISIGYDYRGFSARLTTLHQGPKLSVIGRRPEEDGHTQSINRWDAVIRQRLSGDNLSVYLNFHNITNEPDAAILFTEQFPTKTEFFGRAVDLGFRLTF